MACWSYPCSTVFPQQLGPTCPIDSRVRVGEFSTQFTVVHPDAAAVPNQTAAQAHGRRHRVGHENGVRGRFGRSRSRWPRPAPSAPAGDRRGGAGTEVRRPRVGRDPAVVDGAGGQRCVAGERLLYEQPEGYRVGE
jgi:hypothetical protein